MKEGLSPSTVSTEIARAQSDEDQCQRHIQEENGYARRRKSRGSFPERPGSSLHQRRPPALAGSPPEQSEQQKRNPPCQQWKQCREVPLTVSPVEDSRIRET